MPNLDHFSFLAPWYERVASPPDTAFWRELLRLPSPGLLLDVGGGTGRLSYPLRSDVRGVVVADEAAGMLREARQKDGLGVIMSEAEWLPFATGSFARVMMVDALHHVRDQAEVAREMVRVLEPGGLLLVHEPDISHNAIRVVAVVEKLLLMRSHILSTKAMLGLFEPLGVAVRQVQQHGSSVSILIEKLAA